jgi:hypothetical protein
MVISAKLFGLFFNSPCRNVGFCGVIDEGVVNRETPTEYLHVSGKRAIKAGLSVVEIRSA